jgi:hypothetical protein
VSRRALRAGLALALCALACSRNPVLGDWEIDPDENTQGVLLAAEAAELTTLRFESDAVQAPDAEIPASYVIEGDVVRVVRGDGRGEHRVEVLADGRLRVELPIGVTAVFRRAGT